MYFFTDYGHKNLSRQNLGFPVGLQHLGKIIINSAQLLELHKEKEKYKTLNLIIYIQVYCIVQTSIFFICDKLKKIKKLYSY